MKNKNIHTLNIENFEKFDIKKAIDAVFSGQRLIKEEVFIEHHMEELAHKLPSRIKDHFANFKTSKEYIALKTSNNPFVCENIEDTPNKYRKNKPFYINKAEALHGLYTTLLGDAYGLTHQQEGVIFNRIIPIKSQERISNHSGGSADTFDFHTEDAFLNEFPNYISLYCIRNYEEAFTNLSYILKDDLSEKTLNFLLKEPFEIKPNDMYADKKEKGITEPIISLNEKSHYLNLRVNLNMINSSLFSIEKKEAFDELTSAISRNKLNVVLKTGESIYIDNHTALHARSPYIPNYGSNARWLCRVISKKSHIDKTPLITMKSA